MSGATTSGRMSPGLLLVAERAKRDPNGKILALAHLIDIAALRRAYDRQRKDAAVGVDGMTKKEYGQNLEERQKDLHQRLVSLFDRAHRDQEQCAGNRGADCLSLCLYSGVESFLFRGLGDAVHFGSALFHGQATLFLGNVDVGYFHDV